MLKFLRVAILILFVAGPIVFYKSLNKKGIKLSPFAGQVQDFQLPKIALVFDDLGESLSDLKEVYSLGIPLTISIIPDLRFSKNIAHIGHRCGFSIFVHLPLEPEDNAYYKKADYEFIRSELPKREAILLTRQYLNSIRIAIGVNNHMGSKATRDEKLMRIVMNELKMRGLMFVDSRTAVKSVAYKIAQDEEVVSGYSEGFLDPVDDKKVIKDQMFKFIKKAKEKGKIIIIAHPRDNTIEFLESELPDILKEVDFVTMKEYFEL